MAKEPVDNQMLLFKRRERARDAIMDAAMVDGRKGGPLRINIIKEQSMLYDSYYIELERVINEAEKLNVNPKDLPVNFGSEDEILDHLEIREETLDLGYGETITYNSQRFLTKEILQEIVMLWHKAHGKMIKDGVKYFFNDTFIWHILRYYKNDIVSGDLSKINFNVNGSDRPLIYSYLPNKLPPDVNKIDQLLKYWVNYEKVFNEKNTELSIKENEADRSRGFWPNSDEIYGNLYAENGHIIYEISSMAFWDYITYFQLLAREEPQNLGQGPKVFFDAFYRNHKESMYGPTREMSREEFERKARQQYLYLSNEEKQIRIDLFREIDPENKSKGERFTGGIFHVFDHYQGLRTYAKESKGDYYYNEEQLFEIIRNLFFCRPEIITEPHINWGRKYTKEGEYQTDCIDESGNVIRRLKKWKAAFTYVNRQDMHYLDSVYISG